MRDKLKELMAEILGVDISDIEEDGLLREDFGMAGPEMTELLERIKEEYRIEIPLQEINETETVGEFLDLVESYVHEEL